MAGPGVGRQPAAFPIAEAAMLAFGDAVATSDDAALGTLLGADYRRLIPPVGADARYRFLSAWSVSHKILPEGADRALVAVGDDGWTLPVPLVKSAQGWYFNVPEGVDEMRVRRIGRNELAVIQTMLAVCDAQREYASVDHDGDGVLVYAGKLSSSPGKRDGLYWPTGGGEPPSPLGPAFLAVGKGNTTQDGYYGYRYRIVDGTRTGGARRCLRLRGQRPAVRRLCHRGVARAIRRYRRQELHGQPRGPGVRSRPRSQQRGARAGHDPLRSWPGMGQDGPLSLRRRPAGAASVCRKRLQLRRPPTNVKADHT